MKRSLLLTVCCSLLSIVAAGSFGANAAETVTVDNFVRAETDQIFKSYVDQGAFGKFLHIRAPVALDKQDVIRMNRDTIYSVGVFDLTTPVTIVKPASGDRFQSMQIINQNHSMPPSEHGAGEFMFTQEEMGTRYLFLLFRTFMDSNDEKDVAAANALQDQIIVKQEAVGSFEVPEWDMESLKKVRNAINVLAATRPDSSGYFGDKRKLNPIDHLMGTAYGWGGNPPAAAFYLIDKVEMNDGKTPYTVTVKDVPVTGFWSVTVYNAAGFMEENDLGAYNYNNVTAKKNGDGSITINFGGCDDGRINCLPIVDGWNYGVRLYRPGPEIADGTWVFPKFDIAQ